jgi:hypothetical protein
MVLLHMLILQVMKCLPKATAVQYPPICDDDPEVSPCESERAFTQWHGFATRARDSIWGLV